MTIQNELKEFKNIMKMEEKIKKQKEEIIAILTDEITKLLSPLYKSPSYVLNNGKLDQQEGDTWFNVYYDENGCGLNIFISANNISSEIIDELVKCGFEVEINYDKYCEGMRICLE